MGRECGRVGVLVGGWVRWDGSGDISPVFLNYTTDVYI